MKKRSPLQLDALDAALILKKDGTMEMSLPRVSSKDVPDNVVTSVALAFALQNPQICEKIHQHFVEQCAGAHADIVNDEFPLGDTD